MTPQHHNHHHHHQCVQLQSRPCLLCFVNYQFIKCFRSTTLTSDLDQQHQTGDALISIQIWSDSNLYILFDPNFPTY